MSTLQVFIIPLALAILAAVFTQRRPKGPGNLPPGPPGRDHTGLLEGHRWNTFKAWNDQYVLGTMEAAVDILEKSSEIYSNRPHLIMGVREFLFSRLRGFSMTYGAKWRNWRTLQGSMFGPQVAPNVKPMQLNESASLYIVIARMLWAYDVLPAIVDGKPFIPDADDFTTGLVSYPANLKYRLIPRSENHKEIIILEAERANADMASLDG
ncbi:hypothetical protein L218DRAFT_946411 [Marasmius fiardii PR-910]|nr:hypothetical protein L218DRAFT_946411 [Marasmius fiardii PR-910]